MLVMRALSHAYPFRPVVKTHAEVAGHGLGAGRDRVDLEGMQGGDVACLGQSHDLGQLGAEPGVGGFGEIRRLRQGAGLRLIEDGLALADGGEIAAASSSATSGVVSPAGSVLPYFSTKIRRASA